MRANHNAQLWNTYRAAEKRPLELFWGQVSAFFGSLSRSRFVCVEQVSSSCAGQRGGFGIIIIDNRGCGMVQRFMRGLIVVGLVIAGSSVNAYADLSDLVDWDDECKLGSLLKIGMDTIVPGSGHLIGTQVEIGECSGEVDLAKFTMPEKSGSVRWAAGSTATSGKLMVDIQRRYAFDTNDNPETIEFWTGKGELWRWKKQDKNEYFKAYYTLSSRIATSSNVTALTIAMSGTAVADTGSMTPASYAGSGLAPTGYSTLVDIHLEGYDDNRYAQWPGDGTVKIRYISKKIRGKSVVKNSSGKKSTVTVELGKVFTRSVPKNGKLHQHIVFRPLV